MSNPRHSALLRWSPLRPPLVSARAEPHRDQASTTAGQLEQDRGGQVIDLRGDKVHRDAAPDLR